MITIKELAKILNLAPSTVSMALNDRHGISPDVKILVREAAKKYNYLPYSKARETGMYSKDSRVISIIYPKCDIHITETVQAGIDSIIQENDYHKIRYTVDLYNDLKSEKAKELFISNILENTATNGIILFSIGLTEITLMKLINKGVSIVFLNTFQEYGKCIYMDNTKAAYQAVNRLIGTGRKEIGLVVPDAAMGLEWKQRFDGYKQALKENNIRFAPENVIFENDFSSLRNIAYTTKTLIEQNPRIDAIFYSSDIFAFGGLRALKEMNKKVPEEIAVIGIDDMPIDEVLEPGLSSMKMPLKKMGEMGARMLLKSISEKEYESESVLIDESELMLRKSCGNDVHEEKWV
ncbi:MAG: LacI family DNA-binding transcriptional regulator [bacterium]|nr:LacI family DNA-binding transcriptional regulator [bacterium]